MSLTSLPTYPCSTVSFVLYGRPRPCPRKALAQGGIGTPKRSPQAPHIASFRVPIVSMFRLVSEHFVSAIQSSQQPLLIDPFRHHPAILAGRQSHSDASCTYLQGFTLAHTSLPCSPFACFCSRCLVFICSTFSVLVLYYFGSRALGNLSPHVSPHALPLSRVSLPPHYLTSFLFTYLPCLSL
jgi:hypothetical protein